MKKLYDRTLGCYYPAFLQMELNDSSLSDYNLKFKSAVITYLHEYIHFYQDVTTVYGLQNICHTADILASINLKLKQESEFITPISISSNEVTGTNIDLNGIYYGDNDIVLEDGWEVLAVVYEDNGCINGFENVPEVKVKYKCKDKISTFNLGACCILESMAHEVEQYIYGRKSDTIEFPYNVCRKIVEYYIGSNKYNSKKLSEIIMAFTDSSLYSFHPGLHFIELLKSLSKRDNLNAAIIYDFAHNLTVKFNGIDLTVIEIIERMSVLAKRNLSMIINKSSHAELYEWANDLIDNGKWIRINKNFIFDISNESEKDKIHNIYKALQNFMGTPVIIDVNGDVGFEHRLHNCGGQSFYLVPVKSIYNLFRAGIPKCDLVCNCKNTLPNIYDQEICNQKPWEMVDRPMLCPYAQVWKTWGLIGKVPIIRERSNKR